MKARELKDASGSCGYCVGKPQGPITKEKIKKWRRWMIGLVIFFLGCSAALFWTDALGLTNLEFSALSAMTRVSLVFAVMIGCFPSGVVLIVLGFLGVCEWVTRDFFGTTLYHFYDEDGRWHSHCDDPTSPDSPWFAWWKEFQNEQPVYQLPYGGWFRTSRVIFPKHDPGWKVVHAWDGFENARFQDPGGAMVLKGSPELVASVIRSYKSFSDIWQDARRTYEISDKLDEALKVRDYLGTTITDVLSMIKAHRGTLGSSKHAELIRLILEAALLQPPMDNPKAQELINVWRTSNNDVRREVGWPDPDALRRQLKDAMAAYMAAIEARALAQKETEVATQAPSV